MNLSYLPVETLGFKARIGRNKKLLSLMKSVHQIEHWKLLSAGSVQIHRSSPQLSARFCCIHYILLQERRGRLSPTRLIWLKGSMFVLNIKTHCSLLIGWCVDFNIVEEKFRCLEVSSWSTEESNQTIFKQRTFWINKPEQNNFKWSLEYK